MKTCLFSLGPRKSSLPFNVRGNLRTQTIIERRNWIAHRSSKLGTRWEGLHLPLSWNQRCSFSSELVQSQGGQRSHLCGQLQSKDVGSKVKLSGWVNSVRQFGGINFLLLRDSTGTIQLLVDKATKTTPQMEINEITLETVVSITGYVRKRPEEMVNNEMKTGGIEIVVQELRVLNAADTLPFDLRSDKVNEEIRLRYRYLDLRKPQLQHNLLLRSEVAKIVRNYLWDHGFVEVETPVLFKTTVESGAKEFIVPTRQIGKFYSLPQSPQQYKQILMASGVDRYFQLAKCFRDEGLRSDRQPEFTQIDMELAFVTPEDIYGLMEGMIQLIWKKALNIEIPAPFLRMPFSEAISRFGSDKPDTRFGLELKDITEIFQNSNVEMFKKAILQGSTIRAFNAKKLANATQKELDTIQEEAKTGGAKGVLPIRILGNDWKSPISKYLSQTERDAITQILEVQEGDLLLITAGPHLESSKGLGRARLYCSNLLQSKGLLTIPTDRFDFMWVVDFPLFSLEPELCSTHHPFTAAIPEDFHLLDSPKTEDLLKIRALHYDCVANGVELGGGSIRIHDEKIQRKVFEKLRFSQVNINQFNHLLEALRFGCPPHGGIAFGFDRMMAVLCKSNSIREVIPGSTLGLRKKVIAFPKTVTGNELLTNSPSKVEAEELAEFGIKIIPPSKTESLHQNI